VLARQGGVTHPVAPPDVPRTAAPFSSLLLAVIGGALLGRSSSLSPWARAAARVSGLALIGAAARGPFVDGVRQSGTSRRSATLRMSLVVSHPVEVVFAFVRDFENFPCIIGALRQVRDYGDGRSHWCSSTPSGGTIEWDTVTTKYLPNRVIAWESVAGSPVEMVGVIRLMPEASNTCLELEVEYQVRDSGLADALVALTTTTREEELKRDIERLSSYLETVRSTPAQAPLRT
jgi:uncharacterized membrane protein